MDKGPIVQMCGTINRMACRMSCSKSSNVLKMIDDALNVFWASSARKLRTKLPGRLFEQNLGDP